MQFEKGLHVGTDLEDGEERIQAKESGKLLEAGKGKKQIPHYNLQKEMQICCQVHIVHYNPRWHPNMLNCRIIHLNCFQPLILWHCAAAAPEN